MFGNIARFLLSDSRLVESDQPFPACNCAFPNPAHRRQRLQRGEIAVHRAVVDDTLRQRGTDSRKRVQFFQRRPVDVDDRRFPAVSATILHNLPRFANGVNMNMIAISQKRRHINAAHIRIFSRTTSGA